MGVVKVMSLADDFVNSLSEGQFTYRWARDWLVAVRFGRPVYRAQVYDLLINPLIMRGLVARVGRGLYFLSSLCEGQITEMEPRLSLSEAEGQRLKRDVPQHPSKVDEFAVYLKEKGVKP